MGEASAPRKREVAAAPSRAGLSTQDLILIAVLLAAGAVLKLTVGSLLSSMGMKPNFIIAMYCLAIILTRPKLGQALVIGLLAGLICQIPLLNATPLLNIPSEVLGALACGLLIKVPLRIGGKLDLNPQQQEVVAAKIAATQARILALRGRYQPEAAMIIRDGVMDIRQELNPEQQQKLDQLYLKMRDRLGRFRAH